MFASTSAFGQSSAASPFGSTSLFGRTTGSTIHFDLPNGGTTGSTIHFDLPNGGSIFGGNSTGLFGASTSSLGASSTPAFGSSSSASGSSSTPAFRSSLLSFAGASQQTQPTFGSSTFGSFSPFGASSQPIFGSASAPAFGGTSTAAFGVSSTAAFGVTSTPAFGVSNAPGSGSLFGSGFGSTQTFTGSGSLFGTGQSFGSGFGSTQTFGQSTSATGSGSLFGTGQSSFSTRTSPFGSTGYGQSAFGNQRRGSRVAAYSLTAEIDGSTGRLVSISAMPAYSEKSHEELRWEDYESGDKGGHNTRGQPAASTTRSNPFNPLSTDQPMVHPFLSLPFPIHSPPNTLVGGYSAFNTQSNPISSSTTSNPFAPKPTGGNGFNVSPVQSNLFAPSPSQSAPNLFSHSTGPSPFAQQARTFSPSVTGMSSISHSSFPSFSTPCSVSPLWSTTLPAPAFAPSSSPSIFAPSSSPASMSSPSTFSSASALGPAQVFKPCSCHSNTQSVPTFQSVSPLGLTNASQSSSLFGPSTAPSFSQPDVLSAPSIGPGVLGNLFSSISASPQSVSNPAAVCQTTSSLSTPFQPTQTDQSVPGFSNSTIPSSAGATGQSTFSQLFTSQSNVAEQPTTVTSPFGTLLTIPQMSIGQSRSAPSVQYGISSLPVSDKPSPARKSSFLTSRLLSQRRIRSPARKYITESDSPKVPFFCQEIPSANKANTLFMPRENPRALWPSRANTENVSLIHTSIHVYKNGDVLAEVSAPVMNGFTHQEKDENAGENTTDKGTNGSVHPDVTFSWVHDGDSTEKEDSQAANEHEHEHEFYLKTLMPKLKCTDYYIEPPIQELAVKELAEPGFCGHVKDFVVGRHGYGKIKFLGETDIRRLDLDLLVQFNNREVIVYMDESKKPPVGHGLNMPAEVTLLNIKCIDKKSGKECTDGSRLDKYREMLIKKARDQGAEFVSYNPVEGEWKFRVEHF